MGMCASACICTSVFSRVFISVFACVYEFISLDPLYMYLCISMSLFLCAPTYAENTFMYACVFRMCASECKFACVFMSIKLVRGFLQTYMFAYILVVCT